MWKVGCVFEVSHQTVPIQQKLPKWLKYDIADHVQVELNAVYRGNSEVSSPPMNILGQHTDRATRVLGYSNTFT